MANRSLERGFQLIPSSVDKLKLIGINNVKDLLSTSILTFISGGFSESEVADIINKVTCKMSSSRYLGTSRDILRNLKPLESTLSSGVCAIDFKLRGGLKLKSITEICGPPGIGKTQFCVGVCAHTLLSTGTVLAQKMIDGSDISSVKLGGVIYFDTELKLDVSRLSEIIQLGLMNKLSIDDVLAAELSNKLLDYVTVKRPLTCKQLLEEIEGVQNDVIINGIQLIVIDSIAALARKENLSELEKEVYIVKQASILKRIAELCNCVVLVSNQIISDSSDFEYFQAESENSSSVLASAGIASGKSKSLSRRDSLTSNVLKDRISDIGGNYRPALGATWQHCVGTRLMMFSRCSTGKQNSTICSQNQTSRDGNGTDRFLSLTKSPMFAEFETAFKITSRGIETLP